MADTTFIKNTIEPFVREWLTNELDSGELCESSVDLLGGLSFKFDAVSRTEHIVASVLSSRATTVNGNENTGGVRKAINDVQSLKLIAHDCRRLMVFTDKLFCELIKRRSARYDPGEIEFVVCELPPRL